MAQALRPGQDCLCSGSRPVRTSGMAVFFGAGFTSLVTF